MIKKPLDKRKLREFAAVVGGGCLLLFTVLPWMKGMEPKIWPVALSVVLAVIALVRPEFLRPLYRVWMRIGETLGWVNSKIILAILFYFVITPIAILKRLGGKDSLRLKFCPESATYRQPSRVRTRESMVRPF